MGQLWTFLTHVYSITGPAITLLYPLYASICAMESSTAEDDEQWLAYWIIYSFLTLMEIVAEPVLYWIPVWYVVKVALVGWLVLPQFRGASYVYQTVVREKLHQYRGGGGHVSKKST